MGSGPCNRKNSWSASLRAWWIFSLRRKRLECRSQTRASFILALERGHARSETTVVIGDSWALDVLGAHHAGIRSIWLNRGQEPCPDARLSTELSAFEPLENALKALQVT